jgi:hypothetical protein
MMQMKTLLKLEETGMLIAALAAIQALHFSWAWFGILFLAPDLGMLGYLAGPRVGAVTYNITHHKGLALILFVFSMWQSIPLLQFASLILFAHSSFDRILGYGLKFPDSFQDTHLGKIGKAVTH